jgi:dihydroorotase
MTDYLLRGVRPLGAAATDLLLRDGVVADVGTGLSSSGAVVVDGDGLVALPGPGRPAHPPA